MKWMFSLAGILFALQTWAARSPSYSIIDVGALPDGHYSTPTMLNNRLQLIGRADILQWFVPFLWQDGVMTALPVTQTADVASINDRGEWVGSDVGRFVGNVSFPALAPGYNVVAAADINNRSEIVGALMTNWVRPRAYRAHMNSIALLCFADVESWALAVNDRGSVAGWSATSTGRKQAALLSEGGAQIVGELPGAVFSYARDINFRGEVVGTSFFRDAGGSFVDWKSFHYHNGKLRPVGILPGHEFSFVYAINDSGEIVGVSNGPDSSDQKAFLETKGELYDLNQLVPPRNGDSILQ